MLATILFTLTLSGAQAAASPEVVAQIQVHGNLLTSEEDVIRLAEVRVGMPFDATTVDSITGRLRATRRFAKIEVLKRFASIADPTQIILVIIVDDGRVEVNWETGQVKAPKRILARRGPRLMFLPVLGYEDGYGLSYGVQLAVPNTAGARSRLSFPLTWGGEKTAGAELEKTFQRGPFTRVSVGSSITRRGHPFFEQNDDRRRVWIEAERRVARWLATDITTGWQRSSFAERIDTFPTIGASVEVDTRIDPFLSPNAVYGRAAWERLGFAGAPARRTSLEARGHVGVGGQNVLVVRALRESSDRPLPPNFKAMLGGMSNLRGFDAGHAVGDTLVAGSAELRVPLTSPLDVGKVGVSGFIDAGTVYDHGGRARDQHFERGVGGSLWIVAAVVRLELSVARGLGAGTRVQFGAGVTF